MSKTKISNLKMLIASFTCCSQEYLCFFSVSVFQSNSLCCICTAKLMLDFVGRNGGKQSRFRTTNTTPVRMSCEGRQYWWVRLENYI